MLYNHWEQEREYYERYVAPTATAIARDELRDILIRCAQAEMNATREALGLPPIGNPDCPR